VNDPDVADTNPRASVLGGDATPSIDLPADAGPGLPDPPSPLAIGPQTFRWGDRTFVMGIINVTPDSFSGDGLLGSGGGSDSVARAVEMATAMAEDGAAILDVGGESTRPGHEQVDEAEESRRIVPVIAALREALPEIPISVDTTKASVAEAGLAAGADLINDVWGVAADDGIVQTAAAHGAPIVLMHNRAEARYTNLVAEIVADLQAAIDRALRAGVGWDSIIVDPGFGFGKTPAHNLALLRDLRAIRILGRPVLLGTSRKSTLGKVLDLPADERLEATLATTAIGIAGGVDIVRVHDVRANVRAARIADAIIRGRWRPSPGPLQGGSR
jgi:dihydropteroate synthase